MKHKIVNLALVLASIAYPLVLFFWQENATLIFDFLCVLWGLRAYFESGKKRQVCLLASLFFAVCAIFRSVNLALLYPSIVSLGFLALFFYSLKGEAVITKIARLKEKNIDKKVVSYTRELTKIWCLFFIFNAILAFVLSCFENKFYWSIYCSFISYILMGFLFFGEILYRKIFILKRKNGV
ncbi:DNA gyrase subunit B [Campylobacter concisus]|uniref:COG4648 family protein n=1 Tax=Campylobacter concisus TaxID=199 RepID=UPI0018AB9A7E|nr:DNA gyrase subunit B [Campylobacter concisus]QPH98939.1 DNA gyrase subunit B [Campylobacter concisus]QPI00735.1 DNA gyrase subunit B [Campylobacter concisus]